MEEEISCTNCDWSGDPSMLVSKTEDPEDLNFCHCPDCGSINIEDIDDE